MTKAPDFGAMCATEYAERNRPALRPKRLIPTETHPDHSRDLYCIAPPIGRYDITEALGRWIVMLTNDCNMSRIIAKCATIEEGAEAMQDDFDSRMMEGLEYV